jgi:hypothetical protein
VGVVVGAIKKRALFALNEMLDKLYLYSPGAPNKAQYNHKEESLACFYSIPRWLYVK